MSPGRRVEGAGPAVPRLPRPWALPAGI